VSSPAQLAIHATAYNRPVAVFVAILAAFLLVGVYAARRVRPGSINDLIIAGRSLPRWMALLTMTATWVDGGYLLGTAEGAYRSGVASGAQGGLCFGISLVLGGIFFARRMRRLGFHTLIDPFESRFGKRWAAVLFLPAMMAELFWSAELLVAIGSSFDVILGIRLTSAILLAALVVTLYTMLGGLWSVAYTDAVQLALVALGLAIALPFVLRATGGIAAYPHPLALTGSGAGWWDVSAMLVFGGIPWNCYFQRVLSCRNERDARWMSIGSGLLTVAFVVPPLLVGMAAAAGGRTVANASEVLPWMLKTSTPAWVAMLGLLAIVGAVTSSFSASVLSAASMFSWNCCKRLLWPGLSGASMTALVRLSVALLGGGALLMALKVQSVQALWFFTSDLVYVLLFPQLVYALFDPKANRIGSIAAFSVSLAMRVAGGEPLLGIPALIQYPFPYKTVAAATGMVLLPVVSRLTARLSAARELANAAEAGMMEA
jgi:solute carrier family 5 (high affinity choline transporter), member 7